MNKKRLVQVMTGVTAAMLLGMPAVYGEVVENEWIYTETAPVQENTAEETSTQDTGNAAEESGTQDSLEAGNAALQSTAAIDGSVLDAAKNLYRMVLQQPASFDYQDTSAATGVYEYALVMISPTDSVPALLVAQENQEYFYSVKAFQYDAENNGLKESYNTVSYGTATVGGYRCGLGASKDGDGLWQTNVSGGTGSTEIFKISLVDRSFVSESKWSGMLGENPEEFSGLAILFTNTSDTSALDAWSFDNQTGVEGSQTIGTSGTVTSQEGADGSDGETNATGETAVSSDAIAAEEAAGRIVMTGVYNYYSYEETVQIQGQSDPYGGSTAKDAYLMIALDSPQTFSAMSSDGETGLITNTANAIVIREGAIDSSYLGQHITFSIDPNQTSWPSDVSLPIGQPATMDVHVLGN